MSQEDIPAIVALFVVVFDQKVGYVYYNDHRQSTADTYAGILSHGSAVYQMSTSRALSIKACHLDSME